MKNGAEISKNAQDAMQIVGQRLFRQKMRTQRDSYNERMYEICRGGSCTMRD